MKQVEKVSLGGYAFIMEPDAAQAARLYLDEIAAHYEGTEILEGIEDRMAELLLERCGSSRVGSVADVQAIIDILGRPEVIDGESPDRGSAPKGDRPRKRLYRDLENKKIFGVCSGLANYFDIQVTFVRLVFTLLFLVSFIGGLDHSAGLTFSIAAIYVMLAICMPAARTVRQRWESRGEDGSIESIRKAVSQAADDIEKSTKNIARSDSWNTVGRVFTSVVGIILFLIGFAGVFASGVFTFGHSIFGIDRLYCLVEDELSLSAPWVLSVVSYFWIKFLAAIVYFLPFIGMLYAGFLMIFNLRAPKWHPGLIIFVLWLLCIIALAILTSIISASYLPIEL